MKNESTPPPIPSDSAQSRREALQILGASALGLPVLGSLFENSALAADKFGKTPLNHAPRMIQEYFVKQVKQATDSSHRRKLALKTKEEAVAYVESVKKRIKMCFGEEPKRTPLNAKVTGVLDRDGYTVEKIIFESRPGFPVTALLYMPKKRNGKIPGVVGTCGHATAGKAFPMYQAFPQTLAKKGYACLIYDPLGQGERIQYLDHDSHKRRHGGTVSEHIQAGNQQFLVGEFVGTWRAWDGIRALDYLQSREEVDPKMIGVTGNSGGGTLTTWLLGNDQRWAMGAPSCFVTTFLHNMENELPADTEQCPPKALALGLDHEDFLAAQAPDPIIILAQEKDFFDVRGSEEAIGRLKKLYRLLGKEENIKLFVGPQTHGYKVENREAMYAFFNNITKISTDGKEPEVQYEEEKDLWCTPKGHVDLLENTKTVFDFTKEASIKLRTTKKTEATPLLNRVKEVLKLPKGYDKLDAPGYRILPRPLYKSRKYSTKNVVPYAVETEPGIRSYVYMMQTKEPTLYRPSGLGKDAVLYVAHRSSDDELRNEPLVKELYNENKDTPFFACDVRGIGETLPNTCGSKTFDKYYGCDFFYSIHSVMLDRPYLGQKVFDVLRVLDFLKSIGVCNVHLVGKGWGALAATFAGMLHKNVKQVTLKNSLTSYSDMAEEEDYNWPLATMLPNVLQHFDLPECYASLKATKKLKQIDPWGAKDGRNK